MSSGQGVGSAVGKLTAALGVVILVPGSRLCHLGVGKMGGFWFSLPLGPVYSAQYQPKGFSNIMFNDLV